MTKKIIDGSKFILKEKSRSQKLNVHENVNIIDNWLNENTNSEIDKQVEQEAKEIMSKEAKYKAEELIELIQFLSMNEEFKDFSSVSKETAKYFLKQFKNIKNGNV